MTDQEKVIRSFGLFAIAGFIFYLERLPWGRGNTDVTPIDDPFLYWGTIIMFIGCGIYLLTTIGQSNDDSDDKT